MIRRAYQRIGFLRRDSTVPLREAARAARRRSLPRAGQDLTLFVSDSVHFPGHHANHDNRKQMKLLPRPGINYAMP